MQLVETETRWIDRLEEERVPLKILDHQPRSGIAGTAQQQTDFIHVENKGRRAQRTTMSIGGEITVIAPFKKTGKRL